MTISTRPGRHIKRLLASAVSATLVACGGSDGDRIAVPAGSDALAVPATDGSGDTRPPTVTAPSVTATLPDTVPPDTLPPDTLPPDTTAPSDTVGTPCDGTDGPLTTPGGRSITLRANEITRASPAILVLHGFTGTPSVIERIVDLTRIANAAGIAVAYPEGTPVEPGGFGWNSGAAVFATTGVDDVTAIREMLDVIVATGCVDPERITITGESNGAGMTLAALCAPRLDGAFRSAVMVIPAVDAGVLERCDGVGAPVTPLAAVIGAIDTTTPVDGGNGLLPQRAWFDEVAAWRGCVTVGMPQPITGLVEFVAGQGCGSCTELFVVADGPHTWPGTKIGNGGSTPGTFDLNRRIVADVLAPQPGCLSLALRSGSDPLRCEGDDDLAVGLAVGEILERCRCVLERIGRIQRRIDRSLGSHAEQRRHLLTERVGELAERRTPVHADDRVALEQRMVRFHLRDPGDESDDQQPTVPSHTAAHLVERVATHRVVRDVDPAA